MYFELDVARSNRRRCYVCGSKILKGDRCILQRQWREGDDFPKIKCICFNCLPKISDDEFIAFLENLLSQVKILKANIAAGQIKHDDGIRRINLQGESV